MKLQFKKYLLALSCVHTNSHPTNLEWDLKRAVEEVFVSPYQKTWNEKQRSNIFNSDTGVSGHIECILTKLRNSHPISKSLLLIQIKILNNLYKRMQSEDKKRFDEERFDREYPRRMWFLQCLESKLERFDPENALKKPDIDDDDFRRKAKEYAEFNFEIEHALYPNEPIDLEYYRHLITTNQFVLFSSLSIPVNYKSEYAKIHSELCRIKDALSVTKQLEHINTMVLKIKKQTSCLPKLCFQDNEIKAMLDAQIWIMLSVCSQLEDWEKDYPGQAYYGEYMASSRLATDDTLRELAENRAYLKILKKAYEKSDYEEFRNFLEATHKQDDLSLCIGVEDEIEKKIEKKIQDDSYYSAIRTAKMECFYGLTIESLQSTNKYFWLAIANQISELTDSSYSYRFSSSCFKNNFQERLINMSASIDVNTVDHRLRNMYDAVKRFQKIPHELYKKNAIGAEFKDDVFKKRVPPKQYFKESALQIIFQ